MWGHPTTCGLLLERNANILSLSQHAPSGGAQETALDIALRYGKQACVDVLQPVETKERARLAAAAAEEKEKEEEEAEAAKVTALGFYLDRHMKMVWGTASSTVAPC